MRALLLSAQVRSTVDATDVSGTSQTTTKHVASIYSADCGKERGKCLKLARAPPAQRP